MRLKMGHEKSGEDRKEEISVPAITSCTGVFRCLCLCPFSLKKLVPCRSRAVSEKVKYYLRRERYNLEKEENTYYDTSIPPFTYTTRRGNYLRADGMQVVQIISTLLVPSQEDGGEEQAEISTFGSKYTLSSYS